MHHTYPLFRPFLFYVSGRAVSYGCFCRFPDFSGWHPAVPLLLLLLLGAAWASHLFIRYRSRLLFGWLLPPLFLVFGWISVQCHCREMSSPLAQDVTEGRNCYRAELCRLPELREGTVRLEVRLQAVRSASGWEPLREKCRLTVARDAAAESLAYGDVIWFCTALKPVAPPLNDG